MEEFLLKLLYDSEEAIQKQTLNYKFFLYSSLLILLFQIILVSITLFGNQKEKRKILNYKEHTKSVILYNFYYFLISLGVNVLGIVLIQGVNSVVFSPIMSFVVAKYLSDNVFKLSIVEKKLKGNNTKKDNNSEKKDENDKDSNEVSNTNESSNNSTNTINNNISIVNKNENDEHTTLLPYFNPDTDEIEIPEGYTVKTLDLTTILELYGYISPNQKYKMISSSIFDLPEEQIPKLLTMYVLTESELKEAKVILNLIKLKGKLVTKEEALKYIFEKELNEIKKEEN